jgi:hypothetical protein
MVRYSLVSGTETVMALRIRPQFRVSVPGKLSAERGFPLRRGVDAQSKADAAGQQNSPGKDLASSQVIVATHRATPNPTVWQPSEASERK